MSALTELEKAFDVPALQGFDAFTEKASCQGQQAGSWELLKANIFGVNAV